MEGSSNVSDGFCPQDVTGEPVSVLQGPRETVALLSPAEGLVCFLRADEEPSPRLLHRGWGVSWEYMS